jgi:two-component system sensor histidine kinase BaeS
MMRRVLAPLTQMNEISREIAAGNFALRVPASTQDEVGQLARAFNQMSESLEKIENLRRNLMIDVAHELRTPLTNIRGYLEALNDGVLPPSADTLSLLQDETQRIVQLVEDVLQLAKADAARDNLKLESADLSLLVNGALDVFARNFADKAIQVKFSAPDDSIQLLADQNRLTRVFRNLTDNAAKYTPREGNVRVRVESDTQIARVCYINSIDTLLPDDLPHIFERFYRGEKSRSRQHGGAGIGLAIVKELVEAHKGKVSAQRMDGDLLQVLIELPLEPRPVE